MCFDFYSLFFLLNSRMYKMTKPKKRQDWKPLCKSTPEHVCDFSSVQLHYLGVWLLRLRAQSGQEGSSWVTIEFCPDKDGKSSLV